MAIYRYKMVQIPPNLVVSKEQESFDAAAVYLEQITNTMAQQGWEFFRVDSLNVAVRPGCWGLFTEQRESLRTCYVVTFRYPLS